MPGQSVESGDALRSASFTENRLKHFEERVRRHRAQAHTRRRHVVELYRRRREEEEWILDRFYSLADILTSQKEYFPVILPLARILHKEFLAVLFRYAVECGRVLVIQYLFAQDSFGASECKLSSAEKRVILKLITPSLTAFIIENGMDMTLSVYLFLIFTVFVVSLTAQLAAR